MNATPRLKWIKEAGRFVAYPVGSANKGRYAAVDLSLRSVNSKRVPAVVEESWRWSVRWDGWFSSSGYEDAKQAAADRATEEWWRWVQTDVPRNVDLEASMIVARVMVSPMPNSLLSEDTAFLHKVMQQLALLYRDELQSGDVPGPVEALMARMSEELHTRRQAMP